MSRLGHSYRNGVRGRSISTRPGVGGLSTTAHLECSGCGKVGKVHLRKLMPPDQIDQKFMQAGWRVDPHVCPDCIAAASKDKTVTAPPKPSHATMKAQTEMFRLLSDHFDTDAGRYDTGWDDDRVAKETGLAPEFVGEYRRAGFGEIKEAPEIASLRSDIAALDKLAREQQGALTAEIAVLRGRLMKLEQGAAR